MKYDTEYKGDSGLNIGDNVIWVSKDETVFKVNTKLVITDVLNFGYCLVHDVDDIEGIHRKMWLPFKNKDGSFNYKILSEFRKDKIYNIKNKIHVRKTNISFIK